MSKVFIALIATATLLMPYESFAATQYRFSSVCTVPGVCGGSLPVHFGPFATLAQCNAARVQIAKGPFGNVPYRSLTMCYPIY